jgi:hypothetical protein
LYNDSLKEDLMFKLSDVLNFFKYVNILELKPSSVLDDLLIFCIILKNSNKFRFVKTDNLKYEVALKE